MFCRHTARAPIDWYWHPIFRTNWCLFVCFEMFVTSISFYGIFKSFWDVNGNSAMRVPGLGQITCWIVMIKKMMGHSGKKIARKSRNSCAMNGRGCGCTGTVDSGPRAQMCPILEPNTNAQRLSLLSHLLRSLLAAIGRPLAQSLIGSPGTLSTILVEWISQPDFQNGLFNTHCTAGKVFFSFFLPTDICAN